MAIIVEDEKPTEQDIRRAVNQARNVQDLKQALRLILDAYHDLDMDRRKRRRQKPPPPRGRRRT